MCERGWGVPRSDVQAYAWYDMAGDGFPPEMAAWANSPIDLRNRIAARMTGAQIMEARTLVNELRRRGDERGR
jgi:TPR repeat protein